MCYLAFDLGAESGRAIVGILNDSHLELVEIYRFPNEPVRSGKHLYWDVLRLFQEMKKGLRLAFEGYGKDLQSLAIDTWGVDFGLLDEKDNLLGNPFHYRDEHTQGIMEDAFRSVAREEVFAQTGIQLMPINTLYQLLTIKKEMPGVFNQAKTLLMMPDLLKYFFTGVKESEFTISTTTQAFDPRQSTWAYGLLESLGLSTSILQKIIHPCTVTGNILPQVARETGVEIIPVVAVGSHDTASAVAAVPTNQSDYLYISSGTWSLIGTEVAAPVINRQTLEANFTNEGGLGGTFLLLKNVVGLWLVKECQRAWARRSETLTYSELAKLAQEARSFTSLILPNHSSFLNPENMPAAIQQFCAESGQEVPQSKGEIIRCALESLAFEYRFVLGKLENILDRVLPVIHMLGGGIKNELLCQFTANACGRSVITGPAEATAAGNVLVQAMASGEIKSLTEARNIVRRSFALKTYETMDYHSWNEVYKRYLDLIKSERM